MIDFSNLFVPDNYYKVVKQENGLTQYASMPIAYGVFHWQLLIAENLIHRINDNLPLKLKNCSGRYFRK